MGISTLEKAGLDRHVDVTPGSLLKNAKTCSLANGLCWEPAPPWANCSHIRLAEDSELLKNSKLPLAVVAVRSNH